MTTAQWKPEKGDDGRAKFGKKAKTWLRRHVRSELFKAPGGDGLSEAKQGGLMWDEEQVLFVLDWYADRWDGFVEWMDDPDWRGGRFSSGQWAVRTDAIVACFGQVDAAYDMQADSKYTTLDEWLRAESAGKLLYRGAPSGMLRLTDEACDLVLARRQSRERIRVCSNCQSKFPATRNQKRCAQCLQAAKSQRSAKMAYLADEMEGLIKRVEGDTAMLTPAQFGKLHNTSAQSVTAWCRSGKLTGAIPNGKSWLIPRTATAPRRRRRSA